MSSSGQAVDAADTEWDALSKFALSGVFPDCGRWHTFPILHIACIETTRNGRGRRATRKRK